MHEQPDLTDLSDTADFGEPAPARPEPTGDAAVDAVVDDVTALEDRPLEEHVSAFEHAHEQLRRALETHS